MNSATITAAIPAAFGLVIMAVGFRLIGPLSGPYPPHDPKHLKAEKLYRVIGPLLLLSGIGKVILSVYH